VAREKVYADITGTIWKVVAQAGERVEAEQTILIVESMKMEVPVVSPVKGVLSALLVKEGQQIEEGQELAVIET
jgi:acetyl-CoA carboxylase biotin carboxyl carrier protein